MATPVNAPLTTTSLLVNTRAAPKIVYLPAASTVGAGKLYFVKDMCGNAGVSSIFLSTTGRDTFDNKFRTSTVYGLLSTNFQSVLLASDGLTNWMILQNYNTNVISRGSSVFSPTQISGLVLWLDANAASTFSLSGSTVTQWRDRSGLGNNATAGGSPQYNTITLNSKPGVSLSVGSYFNLPLVVSTNWSMFLILTTTQTQGSSGQQWYAGAAALDGEVGDVVNDFGTSIVGGFWATGVGNSDVTIQSLVQVNTGAGFLCEFLRESSTGAMSNYVNGSLQSSVNGPTGSRTTPSFLGLGRNTTNFGSFAGAFYEVVVYNTVLTTLQRQQVEGYLAWKWGLQGSLPSGHPYKNAPP